MILLGDKTFPDMIVPKKEWSLKAAKKLISCACCFPGEEEEGSEADNDDERATFTSSIGNANNKFVDGKIKFAFDPKVFVGM